jgi:cell shape-determining protein MreD
MNWLNTLFILAAAFLSVYCEAAFNGVRHLLGAQVDVLPALLTYTALCGEVTAVALLSLCGGLWFDSLSANPLGVSVLPLLSVGLAIHAKRDLILRRQSFAQVAVGLTASAVVPVLTLLLLLTAGHKPVLGWGTLWQLAVLSMGGALATPLAFLTFQWLERSLVHGRAPETSFRPDREIRRGR